MASRRVKTNPLLLVSPHRMLVKKPNIFTMSISASKKTKAVTSASSSSGDTPSCTSTTSEDGTGQLTDSVTTITTFDEDDSESESGDGSNHHTHNEIQKEDCSITSRTKLVRNNNNIPQKSTSVKSNVVSFHSIDTVHTIPSLKEYTKKETRRLYYSPTEKEKMLDRAMKVVETKIDTIDGGLATIKKQSVKRYRRYRGLEPLTSIGETEMDKQIDQRFDSVMKEQDCQSKQAGTYTNNQQTIDHNLQILAAKSRVMSAESSYNAYLIAQEDEEEAINVFSLGTFLQDDMMRPFVDDSSPSNLSWKVKLEKERKLHKRSSSRQPKRKKTRRSTTKQQQQQTTTATTAATTPSKPQSKRTQTRRRRNQQDKLHRDQNNNNNDPPLEGKHVVLPQKQKTKKKKKKNSDSLKNIK